MRKSISKVFGKRHQESFMGKDNTSNLKLEKYKEKNTKKTGIIVFTVACVLLIAGVFFYTSFASFESKEIYNLMEGNVKSPGDIYFAYYIDGVVSQNPPLQNTEYTLDASASNCTNGVIPSWDYSTWSFVGDYSSYQSSNTATTRCNLYFVKNQTVSTALGELSVYPYTPDFTKSACDDEACESHEKGIYAMATDAEISYYYRGSVENNYFSFADAMWRVIRVNEDGSIRLIYDGKEAYLNGAYKADRCYASSQFNTSRYQTEYVGYMYTEGEAQGLGTSSTIKEVNDLFFQDILANYSSYIETDAGFCGDRSPLNLQSGVGTGIVVTYNKGYLRATTNSPDLNCENASDLYTVSSSSKGNKVLTYPVGLITLDEVIMAGHSVGVLDATYPSQPVVPNSYLSIASSFWTMTPAGGFFLFGADQWSAMVFNVNQTGTVINRFVTDATCLRPVINLRADVSITGDGTPTNPYRVG